MPIKRLKNLTFPPVIFTLSGAPLTGGGDEVLVAFELFNAVLLFDFVHWQGFLDPNPGPHLPLVHLSVSPMNCFERFLCPRVLCTNTLFLANLLF